MQSCCGTEKEDQKCGYSSAPSNCGTESAEACPIETFAALGCSAFQQAHHEVFVGILKEKIQKAWGTQLDKAADAVLEAKSASWQAMLLKGKAKIDLKQKLTNLFSEGKK